MAFKLRSGAGVFSEIMRLSEGNVGIGDTTPLSRLRVGSSGTDSSTYTAFINDGDSRGLYSYGSTYAAYFDGSTYTTGTSHANAFQYISDEKLKENIVVMNDSLEKIRQLEGVSFNWKENDEKAMGLIAQDVEKIYPELVKEVPGEGIKSVQYGNLVAPLIESVKTLADQDDNQQEKLEKQQEEIDSLKKELEFLKEQIINLQNSS